MGANDTQSDAISPLDTQPKTGPWGRKCFGLYKWLIMNEMYLVNHHSLSLQRNHLIDIVGVTI